MWLTILLMFECILNIKVILMLKLSYYKRSHRNKLNLFKGTYKVRFPVGKRPPSLIDSKCFITVWSRSLKLYRHFVKILYPITTLTIILFTFPFMFTIILYICLFYYFNTSKVVWLFCPTLLETQLLPLLVSIRLANRMIINDVYLSFSNDQ